MLKSHNQLAELPEIIEAAEEIYGQIVLAAETDYRNGNKSVSVRSRIFYMVNGHDDYASDLIYNTAARLCQSRADKFNSTEPRVGYAIRSLLHTFQRERNK